MSDIKRPLKLFLYHAPPDKEAARELYLRLIKDGVDAWLVKDRLLPGQDWKEELYQAVHAADAVIVCLSEHFDQAEGKPTQAQAAFAAVLEQVDGQAFIVPVQLQQSEWLTNPFKWQSVDLFAEAGYETLMWKLQARAAEVGACIERKEAPLPEPSTSSLKAPLSDAQSAAVVQGPRGVLIDGPAVQLDAPIAKRKRGKAMLVAFLGLLVVVVALLRSPSPQRERWYQIALSILQEPQAPGTPTAVPLKPIVEAARSNIVFLLDTSSSMGVEKTAMVRSSLGEFIGRLNDRYLVSVMEFNRNVELKLDFTPDQLALRQVILMLEADPTRQDSCVYDALYAAVQETSLAPVTNDTKNIVVLVTDISAGENMIESCGAHSPLEILDLKAKYTASIFTIHVGDASGLKVLQGMIADLGSRYFSAHKKSEMDKALLSISKEASGLNKKAIPRSGLPANPAVARHAPMIFVPAGEFQYGNNIVTLDAFWIDKMEVTNGMYAKCVEAGKCAAPHSDASRTRIGYYSDSSYNYYPVIFVSWVDANDYCTWAGGRLPTEAEWEKAARGMGGRSFPWGQADPSLSIRYLNYHSQDTTQVGSYPDGASPYGVLDMSGNVGEWVADWFSIDYYNHPPASNPLGPDTGQYRVWRGGSWANTTLEWITTYFRTGNLPTDYSSGLGFRCARGMK